MSRAHVLAFVLPACAACLVGGYVLGRAADGRSQARIERALADHEAELRERLERQDGRAAASAARLEGLIVSLSKSRIGETATTERKAPASVASEASTSVAPATEESLVALASAERMVDEAVARTAWSERDKSTLDTLLPRIAPDDRERLGKRLIVAANSGAMSVGTEGPLF